MTAGLTPADALRWRRVDDYHGKTECGRYSVARVDLGSYHEYVAWRCRTESAPPKEIGWTRVAPNASDSVRLEAIKAMSKLCADDAMLHVERQEKAA